MNTDDKLFCILCKNMITDHAFICGERVFKKKSVKYAICKDCGIYSRLGTSQEQGDFRKSLWKQVEEKIIEILKKRKEIV